MWEKLRRSGLGVRFRRQEPIGPYVADFACHARRLVLEVDGATHHYGDDSYAYERDRWFRERGWEVIHFRDEDVDKHLDDVLATIRVFLGNRE